MSMYIQILDDHAKNKNTCKYLFRTIMIIYMNTKIKQNIIIIASTLHETRQNRC